MKFRKSRDEMEKILREETLGYLGLSMDGMRSLRDMNFQIYCNLERGIGYLRMSSWVLS